MADEVVERAPGRVTGVSVIKEGIGPQRPRRLIAHLAYRTEQGLRYVEVWEAKDDWEAFEHERAHPVVHPLLQDMLGFVPPEPPRTVLELVDAWTTEHIGG